MQSLKDEPVAEEIPEPPLRLRKVKAVTAFRRGKHLANVIQDRWQSWWQFSSEEKNLYHLYNDGTVLRERNEAAKNYGHGLLFDEQEEAIRDLAEEKCFTYRTLEKDCGGTLRSFW